MSPSGAVCAAVVAAAVLFLGGCAAPIVIASAAIPAVQAGTEAFVRGDLESAQIASMERVYTASLQALTDLKFTIISKRFGKNSASITAKELGGRHIDVSFERRSSEVTKTTIRVGVWGDQAISRLILGEIQARCPAVPSVVPDEEPPAPAPEAQGQPEANLCWKQMKSLTFRTGEAVERSQLATGSPAANFC